MSHWRLHPLLQLFCRHRWVWFTLHEEDIRSPHLHISQCWRCSALTGGWAEPRYYEPPLSDGAGLWGPASTTDAG